MSVGLDIGSKTVKIVELSKDGVNFKLDASGVVGYKGNSPDRMTEERELTALATIIKNLHKEARVSSKNVHIALPEQQVFTRTIKFPLLTDQEIAAAIKWESEQYIPIPISEAIVQHQILERRESGSPPGVTVLLVAAPRGLVEKYVKVVELSGLSVFSVETELMGLARDLAPAKGTVMIVDFGARSTDIAIAKDGNLAFSRSVPTAGEAFTRAVAQALGIEIQQAEEYKKTYGLAESQLEGKIKSAIDPVFKVIVDEIKKSIRFYQTEEKGEVPSSIILSGGTSGMPEAVTLLTKYLGLEVVVGNSFGKVAVDPEVSKSLTPYAPLYAVAVGLALKGD